MESTLVWSVPAKMVLFGEWAVLAGHSAIATTLEPRFSLHCRSAEVDRFVSVSPEGEQTMNVTEVPDGSYFAWARDMLVYLRARTRGPPRACAWRFERAWLESEGLGSSSALFVTLFAAFHEQESPLHVEDLRAAHREFMEGQGSGIDVAAQFHGGSIRYNLQQTEALKLAAPEELFVFHTGDKARTLDSLRSRAPMPSELQTQISFSVARFLEDGDWERAIETHHLPLQTWGVVPPRVQQLRARWRERGFISALKTTGAGGGDALLCWLRPNRETAWREDVKSLGFGWVRKPVFGFSGLRSE